MKYDSGLALMIDIETLSLAPNAYVLQVGYCLADCRTKEYEILPTNVLLSDKGQENRSKDFNTISWWIHQDQKISHEVFSSKNRINKDELFSLLNNICNIYPNLTVWASPAMFDLPILTSLFDNRKPWNYKQERDLLTVSALFDPNQTLIPKWNKNQHDAASDAKWQLEYLFNLSPL